MAPKQNIQPKDSEVKKTPDRDPERPGQIHGNTAREHIHRIYFILGSLQNSPNCSKQWLAEKCGVTTKTISRDLASMEALMDVEIVYDRQNKGYRIVGDVQNFPMLKLESRDMLMLHYLRQCLEPYSSTGIGRSMIDSFNRTFGLIAGTENWKKWENSIHFQFEGKPEIAKGDVALFELLHQAIMDHEVVEFDYQPSGGRAKDRRSVEPFFLYMRNGRWYLFSSKEGKPDRRTLAFARISKARKTGRKFTPVKINPKDCFRYSFGVVIGEYPPKENILLEFSPEVAQRVSETQWSRDQKITKLPGGGLQLSLPLAEATYLEIVPWLLSWGGTVQVIAPESLKASYRKAVQAIASASGII